MDYLQFLEELDTYNEWNSKEDREAFEDLTDKKVCEVTGVQSDIGYYPKYPVQGALGLGFYKTDLADKRAKPSYDDGVDHPSHYTSGGQEVIDTIEDVVKDAPDPVVGGLQWNTLKYVMRLWLKDNPKKDAMKARWYLDRLISKL